MKKKRVLFVDDEPHVLEVFENLFEELPFVVEKAYNGNQALSIVNESPPDLMVLDIKMPQLNGNEVCRRIREEEFDKGVKKHLPIIILTGQANDADRIVGKMLGADHYLTKPCDVKELERLIMNTLFGEKPRKRQK